jgi:hypothetical protein
MDDQKMAVNTAAEEPTAVATPPVAEQQAQTERVETPEKDVKTPIADGLLGDLPEDKGEQGKAFAEMRHKVKELEQKLEEKQTRQSSFDELNKVYAPVANQQGVDVDAKIRWQLQEFQARQEFPQLNTDKKFERAVANEYQTRLLENAYNPNGVEPDIRQITKELAPHFIKNTDEKVKEAVKQVKEGLSEKEQAALTTTSRSQPQPARNEDLVQKSRQGDNWAIAERLNRLK